MILDGHEGVGIGVVAGSAVRAGGNLGGIGEDHGESGGSSNATSGWRGEEVGASSSVEIEADSLLGVDGGGETCGERVEERLDAGDFLIANLKLAGELTCVDGRGDVGTLGKDVLEAGCGVGLRGELETLSADDQGSTTGGGEGEAAVAGVDL